MTLSCPKHNIWNIEFWKVLKFLERFSLKKKKNIYFMFNNLIVHDPRWYSPSCFLTQIYLIIQCSAACLKTKCMYSYWFACTGSSGALHRSPAFTIMNTMPSWDPLRSLSLLCASFAKFCYKTVGFRFYWYRSSKWTFNSVSSLEITITH